MKRRCALEVDILGMKKIFLTTVESVSEDTAVLVSGDNKKITLPLSGMSDITPGQHVWLTISSDEPKDAKEVLNAILGS